MTTAPSPLSSPLTGPLTGPLTARRTGPLRGTVSVPGDKSVSHRALMLSALAIGETRITGLLEGEDVMRTAAAMRALGAHVTRDGPGTWRVSGVGIGGLSEPADVLDMGNSGTAARLLCGLLASHDLFAVMTGDASLRGRPMRRVTEPLAACGAQFTSRAGGRLPLAIVGAREARPLDYTLPVASAQVKSAVLLAGLNAPGITRVVEPEPTRDHTERMLAHFGATIESAPHGTGRVIHLTGQPDLMAADIAVPSDPSSAAFIIVAALLVPGSDVTVRGVGLNPLRTGLFTTLLEMGADLTITDKRVAGGEHVGDVAARHSSLTAVEVPATRAPSMIDEYPILAVAAAFADGMSRLCGLQELRVKESDRLAATLALLHGAGVAASVEGDDLLIRGGAVPGGGVVATHMDHRLAMSGLVLGLASDRPVTIDDHAFIDTSFPGFVALLRRLGADLA